MLYSIRWYAGSLLVHCCHRRNQTCSFFIALRPDLHAAASCCQLPTLAGRTEESHSLMSEGEGPRSEKNAPFYCAVPTPAQHLHAEPRCPRSKSAHTEKNEYNRNVKRSDDQKSRRSVERDASRQEKLPRGRNCVAPQHILGQIFFGPEFLRVHFKPIARRKRVVPLIFPRRELFGLLSVACALCSP